jgi:4-diphosphocytidyl-2-C-methyl-D-erythritol kinase
VSEIRVSVRAHAKVNAFLRVLGRRDDGFHDIESLVLPVSLHDLVVVRAADDLSFVVSGEHAAPLHDSVEHNLALVAARALADAVGISHPGAAIEIVKRIPVSSGLGGGSADAAATLHALNELWGCGVDDADLATIGVGVGSDVPAQLAGEAVFVSGRGERVEPVHVVAGAWVLAPQPFEVRSASAYAWWDEYARIGPDPGAVIAAAETGNHVLFGASIFDDLQEPVARRHPEIDATAEAFAAAGALGAVMSGSGPTVAALAADLVHADRLAEAVPGSIVVQAPPAIDRAGAG